MSFPLSAILGSIPGTLVLIRELPVFSFKLGPFFSSHQRQGGSDGGRGETGSTGGRFGEGEAAHGGGDAKSGSREAGGN